MLEPKQERKVDVSKEAKMEELIGQTLVAVSGEKGADEIVLTLADGRKFKMHHDQDCCEAVAVEDICGAELKDLIGSPILVAEESTNQTGPEGWKPDEFDDSFTWTFYKLATVQAALTIRWFGSSNGYYSESVDCIWG